jgi:hypothetical protein
MLNGQQRQKQRAYQLREQLYQLEEQLKQKNKLIIEAELELCASKEESFLK